ncbi:MAG: glycosyltransferase family 2 protein [Candidatus Cryptobacteroides sp.]
MNCSEKISVIIPVYNTEKYLEASLRSIMNQTYTNLEIICVNDGSTDSSLDILKRLAAEDDRIVILDQKNAGQGAARNAGLQVATADWVTFPDSDDLLVPDTYETVVKAFGLDPDLVHFSMKVVYENCNNFKKSDREYYSVKTDGLFDVTNDIICGADSSVSNKVFKRSLINRYGIHFEKIRYEDYQFSKQYLAIAKTVFCISRPMYLYLRREGSTMDQTFQGTPHSIDHMKAYVAISDFYKRNLYEDKVEELLCRIFVPSYWCAIYYSTDESRKKVVEMADSIYNESPVLMRTVTRNFSHGTLHFFEKKPSHFMTKILEFLFSIKYENHFYKPYKVTRLFSIPLSKVPVCM